jgi:phosphoribosylformylglycinamidine synthase
MKVTQFFRADEDGNETCFHVVSEQSLNVSQVEKLEPFLQELPGQVIFVQNSSREEDLIEVGTRPPSVTPWSSNAVSILRYCGLPIDRIERTRRLVIPVGAIREEFIAGTYDRMTECPYPAGDSRFLLSFLGTKPEPVFFVPVLEKGADILREISKIYGLAFNEDLIAHLVQLFGELGRNPTIVELFQIGQMCSDHSRHITWNAKLELDNELMPFTLFDLAKAPYEARMARGGVNHVIAFHDNSSAIHGFPVMALVVAEDGRYVMRKELRHPVAGSETHNYPTSISPPEGSITGIVGCYRDPQATQRGGVLLYSSAGFCTGFPRINGFWIPGEEFVPNVYPSNLASPLQIMLGAPEGAWAGGNQCGVPVIQGFARAVELMVGERGSEERYGYLKTLMYAGNTAYILAEHGEKGEAKKGMAVVEFGGEAFPVGLGGAAGSSQILGAQDAGLDFNAVQRGNPQMARRVANVIRRCIELQKLNPIVSIHDQGAGGPCNVLTELIEKTGGRIRLYKINLGDPTMSVIQIWCAEYQERQGILIRMEDLQRFQAICDEEDCPCEVLGEVTEDGRITVFATPEDEEKGIACVDLPIARVVSGLPETVIRDFSTKPYGRPLILPDDLTIMEALKRVLLQVDVGSKAYLTNRVDRSVGGLVAQQQCCGPLQLPVADVAVSALAHFSLAGMASAIGEQPTIMMLNQEAGARMALTEAITNLMWARITRWEDISFPANWMWPARSPGEMVKLYRAAVALRDFSLALGLGQDGGKDSSSMAVKMGEQLIKSPETLVIKVYATIKDITKVVTPDIKYPGQSLLVHIDLSKGKRRLGGSALAQALGQLGDECPDMENPELLVRTFNAVMRLIDQSLIISGHDTTSDGFAVTAMEMAFAGNCGLDINIQGGGSIFGEFFAKEPGAIIEVYEKDMLAVMDLLREMDVPAAIVGKTSIEKTIRISHQEKVTLEASTDELRMMWSEISYQFERLQINSECADAERRNTAVGRPPVYELAFMPESIAPEILIRANKPRVAILRDVGTNGEREMAAAFTAVGFEACDVPMKKLISGKQTLADFPGLVFPGGFSSMDVFGAGKGWALKIRNNPGLQQMFQEFRQDPSKWSLGICNGDQAMKWLRWLYPEMIHNHPLSIRNISKAFESRWVNVAIPENTQAMMLKDMGGTKMGVYVDHGEGRFWSPKGDAEYFLDSGLVGLQYINPDGQPTGEEGYPWNPNGSPLGIAGLCSEDGNHLAMMPHPERSYELWQWPWMPRDWQNLKASPWLKMFQNAYDWCVKHR